MKVFEIFSSSADLRISKSLAKILREKCAKNLKLMAAGKLPTLIRGMSAVMLTDGGGDVKYAVFPERDEPRRSKTDNSIFMSYTAEAREWKHVPNRLFAVPCTITSHSAESFGEPYIIIPFDSVSTIAWTPEDFNYHEIGGGQQLLDLLSQIEDVHRKLRRSGGPLFIEKEMAHPVFDRSALAIWSLEDIQAFSDTVHKITTYPREDDFDYLWDEVDMLYEMTGGLSIMEFFNRQLTPEKMKVKVSPLAALRVKGDDPEIWFRGPFVAILPGHLAISDTPKALLAAI